MTLDLSREWTRGPGIEPSPDTASTVTVEASASVTTGGLARSPRTMTLHAVARDLARLTGVLTEPITAVRRDALVAHIGFLVEQARADTDPGRLPVALSRLRHEARQWSRDPRRRPAMLAAAASAALLGSPAREGARPDRPTPDTVALDACRDPGGASTTDGAGDPAARMRPVLRVLDLPRRHPTTVAYRYFWLLDELPPEKAERVTREYSRSTRWVLRNLFSGGYNRRAHLMWIGGGSGPAT